jgi:hypothetical protein
MQMPFSARRWLRLPSRVALILGMGALTTAGARADAREQDNPNLASIGDVHVRSEGGRIFLSEGGRESELRLSATPQRDRLLQLLEEHGPAGVRLDRDPRLIMSGGGGTGFYWWGPRKPVSDKQAPALQNPPQMRAAPVPGLDPAANPGSPTRDRHQSADKKG